MAASAKKQRFCEFLVTRSWTRVGAAEWADLRSELADISEASLRKWLRESAIPVDQPHAGVAVATLEELADSLMDMSRVYEENMAARRACRAAVIQAKDRARFAANNARATPEKRALKSEMVRWMLVWLDDPAMFGTWASLRRAARPESSLT